jgi:microcompartment protein CcmL/EutN
MTGADRPRGPALALLELDSIARGLHTADEVVKEAPAHLIAATPSTPGRFLVVFAGEVADVEYAFARGRRIAGEALVDELLLSVVDEQVVPAIRAVRPPASPDAIGVIETRTAASAIHAADRAAKTAHVRIVQVVVSRGLHGKGFVTLAGEVGDVTRGVEAGYELAAASGAAVGRIVLPNPDPALAECVYRGEWGSLEGAPLY